MKCLIETVSPLSAEELANYRSGINEDRLFFRHWANAAGLTNKELAYIFNCSDTMIDFYKNGERRDPFTGARAGIAGLRELQTEKRNFLWLIVPTLGYIAGGPDFDGRILTQEQTAALIKLSGAVLP